MSVYQQDPYSMSQLVISGYAENATSVSATLTGDSGGLRGGQIVVLVHAVDRGASLAALGAPNVITGGNAWTSIASVDYGSDGPKLRAWYTRLSTAESLASMTWTVTSSVASWHQLALYVFQAGVIDPTATVVSTTSSHLGRPFVHPSLPIPSGYLNTQRNLGLGVGLIASPSRVSKGWVEPDLYGGSYTSNGWFGDAYTTNGSQVPTSTDNLFLYQEFAVVGLNPSVQLPANGPAPTGSGTVNTPMVGMSLLFLPFKSYATPSGPISGLTDNFTTALDSRVTTTGTPTINGSNQLVLKGGDRVTYTGSRSIRDSQVTLEVPNATVSGTDQIQVILESNTWKSYNQIYMYTMINTTTSTCYLVGGYEDNVNSVSTFNMAPYDPVKHRWWRIRVEGDVLLFDTSPDKVTWFTSLELAADPGNGGFIFLNDQLDDLSLSLRVAGPTTTVGTFDNIGQPFSWQTDTVPTARTLAWQGYTTALADTWHGHDVLIGICDQGTSQAVRTAQNITMVNRKYWAGAPIPNFTPNGETFPGEPHGCFVTSCAVPPGGRFVEAVISAYSGSAATSTICNGLLWCAQQGAKVINLSFGGGTLDQVFIDTFDYLATAYDVQIFIATGNEYANYIDVPAILSESYRNVHSVGAFDEITGVRAAFSNHAEQMSGVAPGLNVTGRTPLGNQVVGSGTSYATPLSVQIAARLLTGAVYSPATVGRVMDTNARNTGQVRNEQGNGAYDLGLASANIATPEQGLLTDIAMPRFFDDEWADVSTGMNKMAEEVDLKGTTCLVRRLTTGNLADNFHAQINWEHVDVDTIGGTFDLDNPYYLTVRTSGLYQLTLQVRFYPFASGSAAAAIMLNGTDVATTAVSTDRKPFSTDGEGVTCAMTCVLILIKGDVLICDVWQNSGGSLLAVHTDFGGTFLSMSRMAPLAPTLSGTAPPVTGLAATATSYHSVTLTWTNAATADQDVTLIRRKPGAVAPTGILDGTLVTNVPTPGTTYVDDGLTGGTQYSYAAFAHNTSYVYSLPATATVTTLALPPAPAPTTGLTTTTAGTTTMGLSWTNPTTGGVFGGTMLRRKPGTVAPTSITDGTLIADLGTGVTSFTDTLLSPLTQYAYAAFSHTPDPVYAATASTTTRMTTVDTTVMGYITPLLTRTRSDGPFTIGISFRVVSTPVVFKGFKFFRSTSVVQGPWQFALWDLATIYGGGPPSGVQSDGMFVGSTVTGNTAATNTWVLAYPPTTPTLVTGRSYLAAVYVPKGLPETTPYWSGAPGDGTPGFNGFTDSYGYVTFPQRSAAYQTRQMSYNSGGTPPVAPLTDGGTAGPNWWLDIIVNPVT